MSMHTVCLLKRNRVPCLLEACALRLSACAPGVCAVWGATPNPFFHGKMTLTLKQG